jgi:hypothetical protein
MYIMEGAKRAREGVVTLGLLNENTEVYAERWTYVCIHFRDHMRRSFSNIRV